MLNKFPLFMGKRPLKYQGATLSFSVATFLMDTSGLGRKRSDITVTVRVDNKFIFNNLYENFILINLCKKKKLVLL